MPLAIVFEDDEQLGELIAEIVESEFPDVSAVSMSPVLLEQSLAEQRPDFALLDWPVHGRGSVDAARMLRAAGVPFVVLSTGEPAEWDGPVIRKPFEVTDLLRAIAAARETQRRR